MEEITEKVQALAKDADDATRKRIIDTLRELCHSIETPQDSMQRISYLFMQTAVVRIGLDLNLFTLLSENKDAMTVQELAIKTKAAPLLLSRILRYLASVGTIKEAGKNSFTANNITVYLSDPGVASGIHHNFATIAPAAWALPDFLAENGYQDLDNVMNTPFQKALSTDLPIFLWFENHSKEMAHFNRFMVAQHMGMRQWLDVYPIKDRIKDLGPEETLFLDIGGGIGHQSIALRQHLPSEVKTKIIVQDLGAVVQHAIPHEGVEAMEYSFFKPQPIQGARIYYLRHIIHDYPDETAVTILKNTISAMGPDSVILIDEMVLPDTGVHWHATQIDITMMVALAAQERTNEQWHALMEKAGLKINHIYTYTESLRDSILECVPLQR